MTIAEYGEGLTEAGIIWSTVEIGDTVVTYFLGDVVVARVMGVSKSGYGRRYH